MRTTKKTTTYLRLFKKYTKTNHLRDKQMKRLLKNEFKVVYSKHIFGSLMNIWGTHINNKQVISKDIFPKLFQGPDGFLRDFKL